MDRSTHTDIKQHRTRLRASIHATKHEKSGNGVVAPRKVASRGKDEPTSIEEKGEMALGNEHPRYAG